MNKFIKTAVISTVFTLFASSSVFADGLVFDPEAYPNKVDIAAASTGYNTTGYYAQKSKTTGDMTTQTRENNNLQNALFELDSAQVDVRNQLLDAKAKYTEIDNQYKLVKEQRKIQRKTVRDGERRIKQIEKTKENIRKNMQLQ